MREVRVAIGSILIGVALARAVTGSPGRPAAAPPAAADWRAARASGGTLDIARGVGGHFFVTGDVAGTPVRFMVDTGATTVALSRADAKSVGVAVDRLAFDGTARTASGDVRVAHVTLPRLRIGDIQLLDVAADVIDTDDGLALLGQSFLGRIEHVSIEGDTMRLTKA